MRACVRAANKVTSESDLRSREATFKSSCKESPEKILRLQWDSIDIVCVLCACVPVRVCARVRE